MTTIVDNKNFSLVHTVWEAILTFFVGIFFYFRHRDDKALDDLQNRKADRETLELVLTELRDSRKERRDDFQLLNARLDELFHRSPPERK